MALYDVLYDPVYASGAGNAAWVGPLRAALTTGNLFGLDYVRLGGLHFLATANEGTLEINVWDQGAGGALTTYTMGTGGSSVGDFNLNIDVGDNAYQVVQLVTDDTNVWLVAYVLASVSFVIGHSANIWQPNIYLWNGAGFTHLDHSSSDTLNRGNDGTPARGAVGRIAACASAAEAGVMHFAWSESGSKFDVFTGDRSQYEQRLVIVKCDTAGIVSEFDLFTHTSGAGVAAAGYNVLFETYATPVVTHYVFMTNAAGSPLIFYALGDHYDTSANAGGATYPATVYFVDVTTSANEAPAVLQTITGSTYDATITELDDSMLPGLGGNHSPVTISAVDTVYVGIPFTASGIQKPKLLAAPASGSGAFANSDGGTAYGNYYADDWDDTDNIWSGSLEDGNQKAVLHYHRECPGVEAWAQFIPFSSAAVGAVEGPTISLNGDHLYVPGRSIFPDSRHLGIIDVSILRDYRSCGGLHSRYPPI